MKKIWKVMASTLAMAFCFTGLFACDGDDEKGKTKSGDGVIGGKYTAVTSEKQKETLTNSIAKIDGNTLLGNTEAADWAKGLTFSWKNDIGYSCGGDFFDTEGTGTLNMYVSKGTESYDFAAALEMAQTLTASQSMVSSFNIGKEGATADAKVTLEEKAYFDMTNLYFDTAMAGENCEITAIADMINGKKKIAVQDIMEIVMSFMGGAEEDGSVLEEEGGADLMSATISPEAVSEATMVLAMLDAYKVEVSVDYSDGLKIKLETSDETWDMLKTLITGLLNEEMSGNMLTTVTTVLDAMELDAELYVHIAKSGELKAVAAKIEMGLEETDEGETVKVDAEISFNLAVNDKKVTLPENIATDESYVAVDISAFLENFGG